MFKELILADFRERTRRYSYLVTLGFVLFYAYLVVTGKYTLQVGDCRGVYNAAWTGSLMAIGSTTMLMLFGFYLVNNSIRRDRETGVGEILTTTSLGKIPYLMAKFLSNGLVLATMIVILIPVALLMQLFLGETRNFSLWAFLSPFLFISLPMIAFVSAVALLFESIRFLRAAFGNVVYFILFNLALIASIENRSLALDLFGTGTIIPHMQATAAMAYPHAKTGLSVGFLSAAGHDPSKVLLFEWMGYPWPGSVILAKVLFVGLSLMLVLLAGLFFRGFGRDAVRLHPRKHRKAVPVDSDESRPELSERTPTLEPVRWRFSLPALVGAELRVMLKGIHWFYFVIALGLVVLSMALPADAAFRVALPLVWLWPLALWSGMGTREHRFGTHELMMTAPRPLSRQLPAAWLAGVLLTLVMGCGVLLRSLLSGEIMLFLALLVATVFIPTLALVLGKLSGSKKPFEILYVLLWYIGPVNKLPALNFMSTDAAIAHSFVPVGYLLLTLLLLVLLPAVSRRTGTI